jgi:hypothetical protein
MKNKSERDRCDDGDTVAISIDVADLNCEYIKIGGEKRRGILPG